MVSYAKLNTSTLFNIKFAEEWVQQDLQGGWSSKKKVSKQRRRSQMAKVFTTKAYTINYLINEVRSLNERAVRSESSFISEFSPRKGAKSAKMQKLNSFLNGKLPLVIKSGLTGTKSIKKRVLAALEYRKAVGKF
jgi:hypothetical protein